MTDRELLPCPFCGLDVTDDEGCFPLDSERTQWEVRCGNPSCYAHDPCDKSLQAAAARWNRRATAARDAEIEALRAEVERLNLILGRIVEGDGDSNLTIRAGADAFAAAREYLRPNTVEQFIEPQED